MPAVHVVAGPMWLCHPQEVKCKHGHLRKEYKTGMVWDQRRVDGHVFVACQTCTPTTYAFGVIHSRPSPIIHFYEITKPEYDFWLNTTDDELEPALDEGRETQDILHRLGYNPTFTRKGR